MTQATHTPGPWRIVTDGISHWIEIEPNKIALIHAKKADRDLIAAAPDLLAALETALPWLIKADIDGAFDGCALPLGGRKAWEQIERAIAKAKGN
jgi:hypothetical protein